MNVDPRRERLKSLDPAKRQLLLQKLQEEAARTAAGRVIPRRRDRGPAPLSFAQQRLWFLDRLVPGSPAYNLPFAVRLYGPLDTGALSRSLGEILRRHEVLRARFVAVEGLPLQVIEGSPELRLPTVDFRALSGSVAEAEARRLMHSEARRPFDLERGPLLRALLTRLGHDDHGLLFIVHHAVFDGWSTGNFLRELAAFYQKFAGGLPIPVPELEVQYIDYASWQRGWLQGEVLERHLAHWRGRLAGAPAVLDLPADRPRPATQTFRGATRAVTFAAGLAEPLRRLSREAGATLFMTLLTGFQVLLARLSGQTDILMGTPVANRTRPELDPLIGLFVNILVLRSDLSGNPAFRTLLAQVSTATLAAYDHLDLPFEKLIDELDLPRSLGHNPLFQVAFALQNAPAGSVRLGPDLWLEDWGTDSGAAQFDLNLSLIEEGDDLVGGCQYSTDLFEAVTVERWIGYLGHLLAGIAADPQARIEELPLLGEAERYQALVGWNDTSATYAGATRPLHELIFEQAERAADAVAVWSESGVLTYRELAWQALNLARCLGALEVGPEVRVGVCAERGPDLVVGLLGVLAAGGAYVPLDPDYPQERLAFMLQDSQVAVVLAQERFAAALPGLEAPVVLLEDLQGEVDLPIVAPAVSPQGLAYVIYTSGSTGRPKGVMNTHEGICNRLLWMQEAYGLTASDRVLQKTPFSFDVSVWELFWPLMTGARLVMARPGGHRDGAYLAEVIEEQEITTLHFVPSMLAAFLETPGLERCRTLRRVIASGEALSRELVERCAGRLTAELHNLYGPTEAAVDVTFHACRGGADAVPIGRPIANVAIYLASPALQPVPLGVAGELLIGGIALARGYLGRPDLTAERFVPDPFGGRLGERLYRTGDLARHRAPGEIDYLGRIDQQVKVRGFRIELREIESVLAQHPGVAQAVVAVQEGTKGRRLVAYVVPAGGPVPAVEELREHLGRSLPEAMMPAVFIELAALPLTPNGKLDRKALPAPRAARPELAAVYAPPRTDAEELLCAVWSEVLGGVEVGIHDNFFALGGDSILSLRAVALARQRGLPISLADTFRAQTVAALATVAAVAATSRTSPEGAGRPAGPFSLLPAVDRERLPEDVEDAYPLAQLQQGMLYHMALTAAEPLYHNVDSWHLRGRFEEVAFREAVRRVVARHPALRTSFDLTSFSEPLQLVHREVEPPVTVEDLRHLSAVDQEEQIAAFLAREKRRVFGLGEAPQMRFHVHRTSSDTFYVTLTENHAISDGWSLHSTLAEIAALYFARLDGAEPPPLPPLPPLPLTYRDHILLERQALESQEARAFWTEVLRDCPATELPPTWVRPGPEGGPRTRSLEITLPAELLGDLKAFCRRAMVPLKSAALAAHLKVLSLLSGHPDVVSGMVANGRPEESGGDQVRGLFLNTLPFRLRLAGGSWRDLVEQVFARERELLPHRRYPLAALQREHGDRPLFEASFNYVNFHVVQGLLLSGRLEVIGSRGAEGANFRLSVHFIQDPTMSQLDLALEYDASSLARPQVEALAACYLRVLAAMAADPAADHRSRSFLSDAERQQRLEWNDTRAVLPGADRLEKLFDEQAVRTPEAIALELEEFRLSFAELGCRADRLAAELRSLGVGSEAVVGLCAERSPDLMIALLAILKAGGAFLFLDPGYPREHLAWLVDDAGVRVLLIDEGLRTALSDLPGGGPRLLPIAGSAAAGGPPPGGEDLSPDALAYVIYTSGSTGRPKGVMVSHGALANRIRWMQQAFPLGTGDAVLQKTPLSFDAALWEVFLPLAAGARLVLARPGGHQDPVYLAGIIAEREVTCLQLVPSLLGPFLDQPQAEACTSLRRVFCGGEVLGSGLRQRFHAALGAELCNLYGPTECAIDATFHPCPRGDERPVVPIGRPLANVEVQALDGNLHPVPPGAPGELCVGGAGLARGYLGRPDLTAERFVPDPGLSRPGARLYRTGDRGRSLSDGTFEYLGRLDHQVKVRGFRIEPGEIEAALGRHPEIREAAVRVWEGEAGEARLVAYVVPADSRPPLPTEIRAFLAGTLPAHLVPAGFEVIGALPRTRGGKLDRTALPPPRAERPLPGTTFVAPRSEIERALAAVWKEVLRLDEVGVDDNFFDLGGDSLRLLRLHARIRQLYAPDLSVPDLFRLATIGELAAYLAAGGEAPPLEPVEQRGAGRLASAGRQAELRRQRRASRGGPEAQEKEEYV